MRVLEALHESKPHVVVAISIWLELACGIETTSWTAFSQNPERNFWIYLIFGLYAAFALALVSLTVWQLCIRLHLTEKKSSTLNWLWVICTIVTVGVLRLLLIHHNVLNNAEKANTGYKVFTAVLLLFPLVYVATTSSSLEQIPFLVFVILIQIGSELAAIILANFDLETEIGIQPGLIFACLVLATELLVVIILIYCVGRQLCCTGIDSTSVSTNHIIMRTLLMTGRLFCILTGLFFMAIYSGYLITEKGSITFVLYVYSCYLLLFLGFISKDPKDAAAGMDFSGERARYRLDFVEYTH